MWNWVIEKCNFKPPPEVFTTFADLAVSFCNRHHPRKLRETAWRKSIIYQNCQFIFYCNAKYGVVFPSGTSTEYYLTVKSYGCGFQAKIQLSELEEPNNFVLLANEFKQACDLILVQDVNKS